VAFVALSMQVEYGYGLLSVGENKRIKHDRSLARTRTGGLTGADFKKAAMRQIDVAGFGVVNG
jgi:hypothetical protein